MKLFDAVGEEILPGHTVVYPVYSRGTITMKRMSVTGTHSGRVIGWRSDGRRVTLKNVQNCVVVKTTAIEDAGFYDWGR